MKLSVLIAAVALLAGTVIKFYPHLLFNVPYIGFFLWVLIGGEVPPFLDSMAMTRCTKRENCPYLKSGDVVVDVCGKCGTNWMLTLVHELRTWNLPELRDFNDILEISPWIELKQFPSDDTEHRFEHWGTVWNDTRLPFREYKSHLVPHQFSKQGVKQIIVPVLERPDVKYLVMVRNPYDMFYSMSHFLKTWTKEVRHMYGDMPILEADLASMMSQFNGTAVPSTIDFFGTWWEYKDLPNVLLLHYSSVFKNPEKYAKEIAKFLGLPLIPDEKMKEILDRVGVKFMKAHNRRYRYMVGHHKEIPILLDDALVRTGGLNEVTKVKGFTDADMNKIKEEGIRSLGEEKFKLLVDGF